MMDVRVNDGALGTHSQPSPHIRFRVRVCVRTLAVLHQISNCNTERDRPIPLLDDPPVCQTASNCVPHFLKIIQS